MMHGFIIPGRLPGTNEIIDAAKSHYGSYAALKRMNTELVAWVSKRIPAMTSVEISITWHEPNEKRDIDNVAGGTKFILDGLVMAGRIPNDTQRYVKAINHRFTVDRKNPRVEVEITQLPDGT